MRAPQFLLLTALATPVAAQQATGTLIPNRPSAAMVDNGPIFESKLYDYRLQPTDAAIAAGRKMAECVVGKRPDLAKHWLDAETRETLKSAEAALHTIMAPCLARAAPEGVASSIEMKSSTLHELLSEAYFRRHVAPVLPLVSPKIFIDDPDFSALNPRWRVATCLSYTQPALVAAVVNTNAASAAETNALHAIIPFLKDCVEQNVVATFKPATLKTSLASAVYRRWISTAASSKLDSR